MIAAYIDWVAGSALPLWAERGFDPVGRRFHERLDLQGRPVDVPHRVMVQARQIHVFAHAARIGWFPEGGAVAESAMASLVRDFANGDGGTLRFAFAIGPAGERVSQVHDAYAHAFILFAIASLYRLNGDPALLDIADRTFAFIDHDLVDPEHGGLFDSAPCASLDKRQNPLMHLFEACLALAEAAPGGGYLDRADRIFDLFERRLFQPGGQVVLEHFARDWTIHPDPAAARIWEPGHHFEWVWLLGEYLRMTGRDVTRWAMPLFDVAARHGVSPGGLIFDEMDAVDKGVLRGSHRLWPHTEAIKAAVARAAQGHPDTRAWADGMAATLLTVFLDRPFAGGWIDRVGADREPLVSFVPASSLYHLFLAATEASAGFALAPQRPEKQRRPPAPAGNTR